MSETRPADLIRHYAAARLLDGLTGADLTVLWDVADRAATKGYSYESAAKIAARYGWHYRTVRRSQGRIGESGVCTIVASNGRAARGISPHNCPNFVHNPAPMSAGFDDRTDVHPAPIGAQPRADERGPRADRRDVTIKEPFEPRAAASSNRCEHRAGVMFISEDVMQGDERVGVSTMCICHPRMRKERDGLVWFEPPLPLMSDGEVRA